MKKLISIILSTAIAASALCLTGCGEREPEPIAERVEYAYASEPIGLPEGCAPSMLLAADGGAAVICEGENDKTAFFVGAEGIESELTLGTAEIISAAALSDHSLILLEGGDAAMLVRIDSEGREILSEDAAGLFAPEDVMFLSLLASDGEDNIYLAAGQTILAFDRDFNRIADIDVGADVYSLISDPGGQAMVVIRDRRGKTTLYPIEGSGSLGDAVELPELRSISADKLYISFGRLYFDSGFAVCEYEPGADTEPQKLLDWINSDIIRTRLDSLVMLDAGQAMAIYNDEVDGRVLLRMTRQSGDEAPEKYLIRLAVRYGDELAAKIVRFNRQNESYRVVMTDYSDFDTNEDFERGETILQNEIISGKIPDIMQLNDFANRDDYISENMFCDLNELIEKDGDFDRSDYFDSVFDAFETDGKLYFFCVRAGLSVLMGKRANLGCEGWTTDELMDFADSLPEGCYLIDRKKPEAMLRLMLRASIGDFVDEKRGECDFDSESFKRILAFCADEVRFNRYSTLDGDELAEYQSDRGRVTREDVVMVNDLSASTLRDFMSAEFLFGFDELCFPGYPSADGGSALIIDNGSFAISRDSAVKEGAWEFIKYIAECGTSESFDGGLYFPTLRSAFDEAVKQTQEYHWFFNYQGSSSGSKTETDFNTAVGIKHDFSDAEADTLRGLLDGAKAEPWYFDRVYNMISEEFSYYLSGEKSLDETARLIQDRVGTYISERS